MLFFFLIQLYFFKVLDEGQYEFIVEFDGGPNAPVVKFETSVEKNKSYSNGNYTQL